MHHIEQIKCLSTSELDYAFKTSYVQPVGRMKLSQRFYYCSLQLHSKV